MEAYNRYLNDDFDKSCAKQYCRLIPNAYSNANELCAQCNVHQQIKVKLLAEFVPFNENNFNSECDDYKKYLDKEYNICETCDNNLKTILSQPINSIKVPENILPQKTLINGENVFVNEKRDQTQNRFYIALILELLSVTFAALLFHIVLNEWKLNNELITVSLNSQRISQTFLLILFGILCSLFAVIVKGLQMFYLSNFFAKLLWIAVLYTETSFSSFIFAHKTDIILLRPILFSILIILSVINIYIGFRAKRNRKRSSDSQLKYKSLVSQTKNSVSSAQNKIDNTNTENCKPRENVKMNQNKDLLIHEQIKALSIIDESDNCDISYADIVGSRSSSANSTLSYRSKYAKSIVLPAKFNYESIAQSSWVAPFKQTRNQRKECLNFPSINNSQIVTSYSQAFSSSSLFSNNVSVSGLLTPPPSIPASITGDATYKRCVKDSSLKTSWPPVLNRQRYTYINDLYGRNGFGPNSVHSSHVSSDELSISRLQMSDKHSQPKHYTNTRYDSSCSNNLKHNILYAIFIMILFCFVIFLSLPVVFKSSYDFNAMKFHITIESLPQNNYCEL